MIITKTPFRLSFMGGGTDLEAFYEREYGAVVSVTLNWHVYIALHRYFEPKFVLKYSKTEVVDHPDQVQHPLIRECLRISQTREPIEVSSFADIPSSGSGLGSSSAFAVGLIKALHAHAGKNLSAEKCAGLACDVEIARLHEPIGKQDQYAAAFGGLNYLKFLPGGCVVVEPILMPRTCRGELENHLILFYTGVVRQASGILQEQRDNTTRDQGKFDNLRRMRDMADTLRENLDAGRFEQLGSVLHQSWLLKRELASNVSSVEIDNYYARGLKAGGVGGKLLGAGGGGFLLFYAPPASHAAIRAELSELRSFKVRFDHQGTRVIYTGDDDGGAYEWQQDGPR